MNEIIQLPWETEKYKKAVKKNVKEIKNLDELNLLEEDGFNDDSGNNKKGNIESEELLKE